MTPLELGAVLAALADDIEGEAEHCRLFLSGVWCHCVVEDGRVRVAAPVIEVAKLTATQQGRMLEANFEAAADARYAQHKGLVYACYLHPLSGLSVDELRSGVLQVVNLVTTFGTTYSGGSLVVKARGWG